LLGRAGHRQGSSCRQLATMSSDSLTMPWPAAAGERASPGAPRRAGHPCPLPPRQRMTRTGAGRRPGAVPAGRMPQLTAPPSCVRAKPSAGGQPHRCPTPTPRPNLRPGQNHLKGKDPVKAGQDVTLRQTGRKGKTAACGLVVFIPDIRLLKVVTMRIPALLLLPVTGCLRCTRRGGGPRPGVRRGPQLSHTGPRSGECGSPGRIRYQEPCAYQVSPQQ
jgi:hypothetical protein